MRSVAPDGGPELCRSGIQRIDDVTRLPRDRRLFEMSIAHRRADVGMAEDGIDLVDRQPVLDQTWRMGVPQRVDRAITKP